MNFARKILHHVRQIAFVQQIGAHVSFAPDRLLILFLLLVLIVGLAFMINPLKRGLIASYYDNINWTGTPITTVRERGINLLRMTGYQTNCISTPDLWLSSTRIKGG